MRFRGRVVWLPDDPEWHPADGVMTSGGLKFDAKDSCDVEWSGQVSRIGREGWSGTFRCRQGNTARVVDGALYRQEDNSDRYLFRAIWDEDGNKYDMLLEFVLQDSGSEL